MAQKQKNKKQKTSSSQETVRPKRREGNQGGKGKTTGG